MSCPAAISIKNTGNVAVDVASQPGSAACNTTGLAPLQSLTCSLTRNILQPDRERGFATLVFEASGKTAGSAETSQTYSTSAPLNVTQYARMTWAVRESSPKLHASNSKSHSPHMLACLKPWNLLGTSRCPGRRDKAAPLQWSPTCLHEAKQVVATCTPSMHRTLLVVCVAVVLSLTPLLYLHLDAASVITLVGTAINTGNVRLRQLAVWPSSLITVGPTCYIRLSNSNSTDLNALWVPPNDVAVGNEVVCTASFPIRQDGLEAAAAGTNAVPMLLLAMAVNATATDVLQTLQQSQEVTVSVSQQRSMSLRLVSEACLVPTEPGKQEA